MYDAHWAGLYDKTPVLALHAHCLGPRPAAGELAPGHGRLAVVWSGSGSVGTAGARGSSIKGKKGAREGAGVSHPQANEIRAGHRGRAGGHFFHPRARYRFRHTRHPACATGTIAFAAEQFVAFSSKTRNGSGCDGRPSRATCTPRPASPEKHTSLVSDFAWSTKNTNVHILVCGRAFGTQSADAPSTKAP